MSKHILLSIILLSFCGCTNSYSKFYTDGTGGINVATDPRFLVSTDKPKLVPGSNNIDNDSIQMLENGYLLLGISSFNGANVNDSEAISHAKKVHAETILLYKNYTGTVSGSMPLILPNNQTTYYAGNISGSRGFANYSGYSTTYGTSTTYVPFAVHRFNYFATFWIKAKCLLGAHCANLTPQLQRAIESNKGVYVIAVVKQSPAFNNDVLVGDIIRKIDNTEVLDSLHFGKILAEKNGQEIQLEIFRNGKTIVKNIGLNRI